MILFVIEKFLNTKYVLLFMRKILNFLHLFTLDYKKLIYIHRYKNTDCGNILIYNMFNL